MIQKSELKHVIFSKDSNYAYKIRQKCNEYGLEVEYLNEVKELILYFIKYRSGIVFIDLKYSRFASLIRDFLDVVKTRQFIIIYLNDNRNTNVLCDNCTTFLSCYDRLFKLLPMIISDLKFKINHTDDLLDKRIYHAIIQSLAEFNISPNLKGYSSMRDCVALAVRENKQVLVFKKDIYPIIAESTGSNVSCIEKSIRDAIKKARENNPECFAVADARFKNLTVVGFLSYLIEKVKIILLKKSLEVVRED